MRKAGNQVVYFAAFRRGEDLFKREDIESAADVVVWSTDAGHEIEPARHRPWDRHAGGAGLRSHANMRSIDRRCLNPRH